MSIRFSCPQGHRLSAASRFAGKSADCPVCHTRVMVPTQLSATMTETGIVRLLADGLPRTPAPPRAQLENKQCPRCERELPVAARVCHHCQLYLVPT